MPAGKAYGTSYPNFLRLVAEVKWLCSYAQVAKAGEYYSSKEFLQDI